MGNAPTLENSRREAVPDILKCISCICVIIIHTASQSMSGLNIYSFNWVSATFWGSLCRFAVPVFFMVTGALLLDPAKEMSIWRIYEHYFLRILLCLLFWALMYELYFIAGYWILYRQFQAVWFADAVKNVLLFDHHFHLYYLQILLIFYILLPVMRTFVKNAGREVLRYALIVWFVLGILLPYLFTLPPFSEMTGIPAQYPIKMTYSSLGYGLLGYYLKTAGIRRSDLRRYVLLFAGGFVIVFGGTVAVSMLGNMFYQDLIDAFTPGVALMAAGVYGIVSALWGHKNAADMPRVVWLSKASFCIYLVHHFFVMLLRTYLYTAYQHACLILIPAQAALVLVLCLVVYVILKRIPWVKNHLI